MFYRTIYMVFAALFMHAPFALAEAAPLTPDGPLSAAESSAFAALL